MQLPLLVPFIPLSISILFYLKDALEHFLQMVTGDEVLQLLPFEEVFVLKDNSEFSSFHTFKDFPPIFSLALFLTAYLLCSLFLIFACNVSPHPPPCSTQGLRFYLYHWF